MCLLKNFNENVNILYLSVLWHRYVTISVSLEPKKTKVQFEEIFAVTIHLTIPTLRECQKMTLLLTYLDVATQLSPFLRGFNSFIYVSIGNHIVAREFSFDKSLVFFLNQNPDCRKKLLSVLNHLFLSSSCFPVSTVWFLPWRNQSRK